MKRKKVGTYFATAIVAWLLLVNLTIPALAYSPGVHDVKIHIVLDDSGNATITEVWDVTVASGTEWYLVQENLGDIEISDFSVADETGQRYQTLDSWDVDALLPEKAGKCGIVETEDGYELCWGVGSYGPHTFTVSYRMSNFVKGFTDYDGFNQRVLNDQLSAVPAHVEVVIEKPGTYFTEDDTAVWAFGFAGEIFVTDGKVVASSRGMDRDAYVTVLVRFQQGEFAPTSLRDYSFDVMEETAMEGSSYDYDSGEEGGVFYVSSKQSAAPVVSIILLMVAAAIVTIWLAVYWSQVNSKYSATPHVKERYQSLYGFKNFKELKAKARTCTQVPFEGNIPATVRGLKHVGYEVTRGNLLAAYLVQWLESGLLVMTSAGDAQSRTSSRKRAKGRKLVFSPDYGRLPLQEQKLYKIMLQFADGNNAISESKFARSGPDIYNMLQGWEADITELGSDYMLEHDLMTQEERTERFATKKPTMVLTAKGYAELEKAVGFMRYIESINKNFMANGETVEYWGDYLTFATLFDMGTKLIITLESHGGHDVDGFHYTHMDYWIYHSICNIGSSVSAPSSSGSSSDGFGGSSSSGGGGGSSGGGSGGGSR